MTTEEAIADIKHAVNWAKENDEKWCDSVEVSSLELALEALKQIKAIESIINVSNLTIQEDVLKYKMIVDVVKGDNK